MSHTKAIGVMVAVAVLLFFTVMFWFSLGCIAGYTMRGRLQAATPPTAESRIQTNEQGSRPISCPRCDADNN